MLVAMEGAQQQQQAPPWFAAAAAAGGAHYPPQPPPQPPPPQPPPPPAWSHPSYAHYHAPAELSQHYGGHPHQQQQHLQHGQFYAQQDQAWPAVGWSQHKWTQQAKTFGLSQEEDWASKARAWATAKSAREANQAPLPLHGEAANGISSSSNSHATFSRDGISTLSRNDPAQVPNSLHLVQAQVDPSIHNGDVCSNYGQDASNAALGSDRENEVLTDKQAYLGQEQQDSQQQVHSTLSTQQQKPIPELYEFHQRQQLPQQQLSSQYLHASVDAGQLGFAGHPPPMPVVWPPITPALPFPASITGAPPGPSQFEQPLHHHVHPQPPHMFVRPQGPPPVPPGFRPRAPFGLLGVGVGGIVGNPERPRKSTVPSWLRDELKKKAAAPVTGIVSDDLPSINGPETAARLHGGTNSPVPSDPEGEEDEDELETVKTAAINQEIKRVLTEVLLKVTDGLFNEIAQEIFYEEQNKPQDRRGERDKVVKSRMSASPLPSAAPSAPARVLVGGDGDGDDASLNTSSAGNLLGLASYASDDDTAEADCKKADNEIGRQSNSSPQESGAGDDHGVGRIKKDEEREEDRLEKDDKLVQHMNAKEMKARKPNEQGLPHSVEHSPVENERVQTSQEYSRKQHKRAIAENDVDLRGRQFDAKCTEGGKLQKNDKDSIHKRDKQHNKENEREAKSKSSRSQHRDSRKSRNERTRERKDTRDVKRRHHGRSSSPSRSISPNARRRSSSPGDPRIRKLQRMSRCESISQSPRSRKGESSRSRSRSRSRSPRRISSSPPREKRRHKHSRSRSPVHRRRRR